MKEQEMDFQVALLMENISEAKIVSDGLRELGIFAHYYQDLDEMWVSLNTYTPELCLVDVKKMSQGKLSLRQHKKIKNKSLKLAFYYKESTQALLKSTYDLDHYGYIKAELNLVSQLRSVLYRRKEEIKLESYAQDLQERVKRLKARSKRQLIEHEQHQFKLEQLKLVKEFALSFGEVNSKDQFISRLIRCFSDWKECEQFGVYELNETSQKLSSTQQSLGKLFELPDLWLDKPHEDGIDEKVEALVYDVAYDLIGADVNFIRITGVKKFSDILIVGKFKRELSWDILERGLSSEYRRVQLKELTQSHRDSHRESIFEAFQVLDDQQFHKVSSEHRTLLVDFSSLVSLVKQRHGNRFYWKAFAADFYHQMDKVLSGNYKIAHYGVDCFLINIDKRFIETDYLKVKTFVEDFQLWKYFEESSLVISSDIAADIRFVAPSSVNVLRQLREGPASFMHTNSAIKTPAKENLIDV
jgi:hypothetical protein